MGCSCAVFVCCGDNSLSASLLADEIAPNSFCFWIFGLTAIFIVFCAKEAFFEYLGHSLFQFESLNVFMLWIALNRLLLTDWLTIVYWSIRYVYCSSMVPVLWLKITLSKLPWIWLASSVNIRYGLFIYKSMLFSVVF